MQLHLLQALHKQKRSIEKETSVAEREPPGAVLFCWSRSRKIMPFSAPAPTPAPAPSKNSGFFTIIDLKNNLDFPSAIIFCTISPWFVAEQPKKNEKENFWNGGYEIVVFFLWFTWSRSRNSETNEFWHFLFPFRSISFLSRKRWTRNSLFFPNNLVLPTIFPITVTTDLVYFSNWKSLFQDYLCLHNVGGSETFATVQNYKNGWRTVF